MNIKPRKGVILVKKHKDTSLQADIAVDNDDEDKKLITGEILEGERKGETAIFGKYAISDLNLKGKIFSFVEIADIIGFCDYKE